MSDNLEVITQLEHFLQIARADPMYCSCGISMVKEPNHGVFNFTGPVNLERLQRENLQRLLADVEESIANRAMPPRDPGMPANYVAYNLAHDPISFDFLVWLIEAEMTRVREKAPPPLRVAFWTGRTTDLVNNGKATQWLDKVFRPALTMLGAVEDSTAMLGRHGEVFLPVNIAAAARAGEPIPRFHASLNRNAVDVVTITLREAERWPHRNSNLEAWLKFALYLEKQGEKVIFVRDTTKAEEQLPHFQVAPRASMDLMARVGLYEAAKMNFFVSNGPGTLGWFGEYPYCQFIDLKEEGHPYWCNTPSFFAKQMGLPPGEQWPWARPDQRIVWGGDTYENMVSAWEEVMQHSSRGTVHITQAAPRLVGAA